MELIEIRSYVNYFNAHIAKNKLESEGIKAFLENEHTISIHPFLSNALGGIRLKVAVLQAEKALDIIEEFNL